MRHLHRTEAMLIKEAEAILVRRVTDKGKQARRIGIAVGANPYVCLDSLEYNAWIEGWLIEDKHLRLGE